MIANTPEPDDVKHPEHGLKAMMEHMDHDLQHMHGPMEEITDTMSRAIRAAYCMGFNAGVRSAAEFVEGQG